MDARAWNERYAATDRVWSRSPNKWVHAEFSSAPPGRALDLACGEGRNALWLAARGWSVVGVDFAAVALERARHSAAAVESERGAPLPIEWVEADLTAYRMKTAAFDLVLISYLHLAPTERADLLRRCVSALAPGGVLFVVAHDASNLREGVGGPQDDYVLFSASDVAGDLQDHIATGTIALERAGRVAREVDTPDGTVVAWDVVVKARKALPGRGAVFAR